MAGPEPGTASVAPGRAGRRPPVLAGGLLVGAGLIDVVGAYPHTTADSFVVMTTRAMRLVDMTGWAWLQVAIGTAAAIAGLVVLADRRWTAAFGIACAALAIAAGVLMFPYAPARAALVIPLNAAAIRLLIRHRRARVTG